MLCAQRTALSVHAPARARPRLVLRLGGRELAPDSDHDSRRRSRPPALVSELVKHWQMGFVILAKRLLLDLCHDFMPMSLSTHALPRAARAPPL